MTPETNSRTPSRKAGLSQLSAFLPHAGNNYARLRNIDYGPGENPQVSTLSPWIRHRLINEQEVVAATVTVHGTRGAEKFIQEVCWRTCWKGWFEQP
jgi:deoxyribodipyrimidine photolyase